jgi:hypothetical protein
MQFTIAKMVLKRKFLTRNEKIKQINFFSKLETIVELSLVVILALGVALILFIAAVSFMSNYGFL